jgi:integrase
LRRGYGSSDAAPRTPQSPPHQGRGGRRFVFPNKGGSKPFNPGPLTLHSKKAWVEAGLTPIGLHECRHSYAAYMIAAGLNSKALSTYIGHASITITLDRYSHLLPGNQAEAAQRRCPAKASGGCSCSRPGSRACLVDGC